MTLTKGLVNIALRLNSILPQRILIFSLQPMRYPL